VESSVARLGLTERQAKLTAALLGEDSLGLVIRAHIHIEHELIEFIKSRLSPPSALDAISLNYAGRVRLAMHLGPEAERKAALTFIGTLRNRFAHQPDSAIEEKDAADFEHALGSESKSALEYAYPGAQAKVGTKSWNGSLLQTAPKDRIALYFIVFWAAIAVSAAKSKGIGV
jgi:hypothetical protein